MRRNVRHVVLAGAVFVAVLATPVLLRSGVSGSVAAVPAASQPKGPCPAGMLAESDSIAAAAQLPATCTIPGHPEGAELSRTMLQQAGHQVAPFNRLPDGAYRAALLEKALIAAQPSTVAGGSATWIPVGLGPLDASNHTYSIANLGLPKLSGRISSYAADPAHPGRVFAAASDGGVWESTSSGQTWVPVGDGLPTQVVGAIAWSPANGGTLIAGTGDHVFCFNCVGGLGVYRTTDDGAHWLSSTGIPDNTLIFKVAVDPTNASNVYVATSRGLFRSTDGAQTFLNTVLPVTPVGYANGLNCNGNTTDPHCFYASIVTDVVVRSPDAGNVNGGKVLAVVGWRAGQKPLLNPDGSPSGTYLQAPQNGLYVSATGAPFTFTFVNPASAGPGGTPNGFAPTANVGRVALGIAHGATQNHDVVYASVEDAVKFNGCADALDTQLPTCVPNAQGTIWDALYASTNFGQTWLKMVDSTGLSAPGNGSALFGQQGYQPGVQAWYNLWVEPDPVLTNPSGFPTRVMFGLEEVWENRDITVPQVGPSSFHVVGRYWDACAARGIGTGNGYLNCGLDPQGSTNVFGGTTTHPDQHAAIFLPDSGGGGETLLVGNDGGNFAQHVDAITCGCTTFDFSNDRWGDGANQGLHTLQPYDAAISNDGTIVMGMQDNGEGKIDPATGQQTEIFGGDGFFTFIDPLNSNKIAEEYTNGIVSITTNGGASWSTVTPGGAATGCPGCAFSTPFMRDPTDANHWVIGGNQVWENTGGWSTGWANIFDLTTATEPANYYDSSDALKTHRQVSALDLRGHTIYAGYCGWCDTVTQGVPFHNGLARSLQGGSWLIPQRIGLPSRFISGIYIDPTDSTGNTVIVSLAGYGRHWVPPGAFGDDTSKVGSGHVFKSTDGGDHFTDISANLPDIPADWVTLHGHQVIVGTDIGPFIAPDSNGSNFSVLGVSMPTTPTLHLSWAPNNPDLLVAATQGRGVYKYNFAGLQAQVPDFMKPSLTLLGAGAIAITALVTARRKRRGSHSQPGSLD
jgi:hypothetical protein